MNDLNDPNGRDSMCDERGRANSVCARWCAKWRYVLGGAVLLVFVVLAGWYARDEQHRRQTARAAVLYEQLQQVIQMSADTQKKNVQAQVTRIAYKMESQFAKTPYAQMTALVAAGALYRAADSHGAQVQLEWAMQHAIDAPYRYIARLRLAAILLDQKAFEAAHRMLAITPIQAFSSIYADRRGDIFIAQHNRQAARSAWQEALKTLDDNNSMWARMIQLKLDATATDQ